MTFKLGTRSLQRLNGVHPDLVKVVKRAIQITTVDFTVLEGRRTLARQKKLVAAGASRTMNSRHLTGHAVDLGAYIGGRVAWDWPLYWKIVKAMETAANELGVEITCGARWKKFPDGPHFQLNWKSYPV
jgi:peptidoglycan L-alanyl-D-glutamate endopeptidase CwlK